MSNWFMDRRSLVMGLALALIAILLAGGFLCNESMDRARILRVSGEVSIERLGEDVAPVVGTVLNTQDKIRTGAGAFIEVAYDDELKDVVRIGSESNVVLESAVIEKRTNIFIDKGDIMLKLDKLEKGSTFRVRTPTAVMGARGTAFGIRLVGKEALLTDFESRIFVKGLTEDYMEMDEELLLNDGWKVRVRQFEKPERVERMSTRERLQWVRWLREINSLPKFAPVKKGRLAKFTYTHKALRKNGVVLMALAMARRATSSVSPLAFLLYAALAVIIGRIFLWQEKPSRTNT